MKLEGNVFIWIIVCMYLFAGITYLSTEGLTSKEGLISLLFAVSNFLIFIY